MTQPESSARPSSFASVTGTLPRVSVLLVDDRPANLVALEASLEPLGQRLVRAASGNDALRAVLKEQFAVILMDIRMPGLDGFATLELLRKTKRARHTPIIFLTAYHDERHSLVSYTAGAVDYIVKPFDPDALRSKVGVFVQLRQNEIALGDAHAELQAAHAELEQRVEARTAELAVANRSLEREILERKTAEQRLFEQAYCLSYLQELPITTMKIDRCFVRRIGMRSERPEIVQAIVSLAHNLGLDVTGEGVETIEQLERLRELGCDHAQGFYFAKPLDPAAAAALVSGNVSWTR